MTREELQKSILEEIERKRRLKAIEEAEAQENTRKNQEIFRNSLPKCTLTITKEEKQKT
jgi:hypothetical protein